MRNLLNKIKFFNEKFIEQNKKFDKLDEDLKDIRHEIKTIHENHFYNIETDLSELKTFKNYLIPLLSFMIGILGVTVAIIK